ncbi:MAG: CBS domain-containing protein [Euzebya sp.]
MMTQGFRHLPVVDGGQVVGIVSLRDVLGVQIGARRRPRRSRGQSESNCIDAEFMQ